MNRKAFGTSFLYWVDFKRKCFHLLILRNEDWLAFVLQACISRPELVYKPTSLHSSISKTTKKCCSSLGKKQGKLKWGMSDDDDKLRPWHPFKIKMVTFLFWTATYREFSPYANFITANFVTAVFQNYI